VLHEHGINIVRFKPVTGELETEHVIARMITPSMHREGLRCDECFGFPYEEAILLKRRHISGFERLTSVPGYIQNIEKEKMKEMSVTVNMEVKNYLNSIYGKGANLNRSTPAKPTIKNVIFNDPATIVMWSDGTKTVVKAENEAFDPEKGLAMAYVKKFEGNQGNYYNMFRKWKADKRCSTEKNDLVPANLARKAYQALVNATSAKRYTKADLEAAITEAIGYLGEALED
jgi:hypothetical protein